MLRKMKERAKELNTLLLQKGANYWIECISKWKNNSEMYCYSLVSKFVNSSPVIYYNEEWYSMSDEEVIDYFDTIYAEYSKNIDMPDMTLEYVCNNIMPKIVSSDNIPIMNKNHISHWDIHNTDLTVCFYIKLDSLNIDEHNASLKVTKSMLESVGLNDNEAYRYAIKNLEQEITIRSMESIVSNMIDISEEELFEKEKTFTPMYVVSNKRGFNGASAILSNDAMNRAKKIMKCNSLIILPSSIHECILMPLFDADFEDLVNMVREINSTELLKEDILTDNVYIYVNNKIIPVI